MHYALTANHIYKNAFLTGTTVKYKVLNLRHRKSVGGKGIHHVGIK